MRRNVLFTCSTAVGCKKRLTGLVYADVILLLFDLRMVSQATGGSRRARKRQRKDPAQNEIFSQGRYSKRNILTAISRYFQVPKAKYSHGYFQRRASCCFCLLYCILLLVIVIHGPGGIAQEAKVPRVCTVACGMATSKSKDGDGASSWH